MRIFILLLAIVILWSLAARVDAHSLRVGADGGFATIQAAITAANQLQGPVVIHIAPGVYEEKLYIQQDQLALVGAGPEHTVIRFAQLREHWMGEQGSDWGAAVVNIRASDIALLDLSVENSYGRQTGNHEHQFAVRLMQGTRIITDNCRLVAGGADTVSLWDKQGMYYHSNCYFEGYVDMVCPRGWAFITHSRFFTRGGKYALWHDGELDSEQKLVVVDSLFDGEPGFQLGRRHYDAQFWLVDARFTKALADQPIFRKTYPDEPARDRPNRWGDRYFFRGAKSADGSPLPVWLGDNMPEVVVTPQWAFGGRWDPEADLTRWREQAAGQKKSGLPQSDL